MAVTSYICAQHISRFRSDADREMDGFKRNKQFSVKFCETLQIYSFFAGHLLNILSIFSTFSTTCQSMSNCSLAYQVIIGLYSMIIEAFIENIAALQVE